MRLIFLKYLLAFWLELLIIVLVCGFIQMLLGGGKTANILVALLLAAPLMVWRLVVLCLQMFEEIRNASCSTNNPTHKQ
jgi:hypothetical protein